MDHVLASLPFGARALLLSERLEHRGLKRQGPLLPGSIVLAGPDLAFAFRWGAVVLISADEEAAAALAARLHPHLRGLLAVPFEETAALCLDPEEEGPDEAGMIRLRDLSMPRLALVAEMLARSALLSHQEAALERSLDRLAPVFAALQRGRCAPSDANLLRSLGEALAARAKGAAWVDTSVSPELLWDHPELSDLHVRLAAEWQLSERSDTLERKLAIVRETLESVVSLAGARRIRALEFIVVLVAVAQVATGLHSLLAP